MNDFWKFCFWWCWTDPEKCDNWFYRSLDREKWELYIS